MYALKDENGQYSIAKILAFDDVAVHLRIYNEKFDTLPSTVDTSKLTYFIGHEPLARKQFATEEGKLISVEKVSEQEREGYRIYLEEMQKKWKTTLPDCSC